MKLQKKLQMFFNNAEKILNRLLDFIKTNTFKSLAMSFVSTLCLPYVLKVEPVNIYNSILLFVIWWCFFRVIKSSLNHNDKKILCFSFVMGCIYSLLLYLGKCCEMYGNFDVSPLGICKIIFITVGFAFVLTAFIEMICRKFISDKFFDCCENIKIFLENDKGYFLKIWFIIMLCWIPFWILMWPAIFSFDLPIQLPEGVTGHYTNWHPVFHTIYAYYSMVAGVKFFNSSIIGCVIYVLPQFLVMSSVFAYCIYVFKKNNISKFVRILSLLFFALYPVHWVFVITLTKDVLFAGFVLLITILFFDMYCDEKTFFVSKKNIFLMFIAVCGILLFRSIGILLVLFLILISLIKYKKHVIKISFAMILPAIIYLWFALYGFQMLNIAPTRPEEAISVPLQQYARVMRNNCDEISQEDKDDFFSIVPVDSIDRYCHHNTDYMKFNVYVNWQKRLFNGELYIKDKQKYKEMWVRAGKKYPAEYTKAFLCLNMPFWYPDYRYLWKNHSLNPYINIYNSFEPIAGFYVPQRPKPIMDTLYNILYNLDFKNHERPLYNKVFLSAILFSTGFPFWILLFALGFEIFRKKYSFLQIISIPLFMEFLYLFSPTYLLRYNYPIIVCLPVIIAIIALSAQENKTE